MKTKTTGRQAVGVSISAMPEVWEFIGKRVRELRPYVKDRSHYIQQLIEADRRLNLLGHGGKRGPFKSPVRQFAGFATN